MEPVVGASCDLVACRQEERQIFQQDWPKAMLVGELAEERTIGVGLAPKQGAQLQKAAQCSKVVLGAEA